MAYDGSPPGGQEIPIGGFETPYDAQLGELITGYDTALQDVLADHAARCTTLVSDYSYEVGLLTTADNLPEVLTAMTDRVGDSFVHAEQTVDE